MRGRRARNSGEQDELKKTRKKKSWRFVAELHQCEICGKRFESARAVFGHLRHHSGKTTKRSSAGEEWQNSELVSVGYSLVVPKRARTMSQNPILNRPSDSVADKKTYDDSKEVEDAAITLMMMSLGLRDCDILALNPSAAAGSVNHTNLGNGLVSVSVLECDEMKKSEEDEEIKEKGAFWRHKCRICERGFDSHQALGGHQTFHRMQSRVMEPEEMKENCKCSVCYKVFGSRRALGSHSKCHRSLSGEKVRVLSNCIDM